jgi:hypothetical protein
MTLFIGLAIGNRVAVLRVTLIHQKVTPKTFSTPVRIIGSVLGLVTRRGDRPQQVYLCMRNACSQEICFSVELWDGVPLRKSAAVTGGPELMYQRPKCIKQYRRGVTSGCIIAAALFTNNNSMCAK